MGGCTRRCLVGRTGFSPWVAGRPCGGEQVGRDERVEADDFAGRRRVEYHGYAADLPEEDRDVVRELRIAVKGEIAGFDTFQIDFIARRILCGGDSGDIDSGVSVGGLRQPGTIISWISGSAPDIWPPDLCCGEGDRAGGLRAGGVAFGGGDQAQVVICGPDGLSAGGVPVTACQTPENGAVSVAVTAEAAAVIRTMRKQKSAAVAAAIRAGVVTAALSFYRHVITL
jgi:hypothetical protein